MSTYVYIYVYICIYIYMCVPRIFMTHNWSLGVGIAKRSAASARPLHNLLHPFFLEPLGRHGRHGLWGFNQNPGDITRHGGYQPVLGVYPLVN